MILFKSLATTGLLLLLSMRAQAVEQLTIGDFSSALNASGIPTGWQLSEKSGRADFRVVQDEGISALNLRSSNTSYSFQRELKADLRRFPILSWKWKVTKLPAGGDFRRSKTDDQAAQLFVAFTRTRSIVYLWDTSAPQGLMSEAIAPPFMSIKVVVVRSQATQAGTWLTETRNVYEDYKKFFGGDDPPVVSGMRLQINSQHTKTSAESYFADVRFTTGT
jgi:hypothetical protein